MQRRRALGLGLGLIATLVTQVLKFSVGYSFFRANQATMLQQLVGDLCVVFGATALCLGYAAGIVLLADRERFRRLMAPFRAVGRFALTAYLMQTVMFSLPSSGTNDGGN